MHGCGRQKLWSPVTSTPKHEMRWDTYAPQCPGICWWSTPHSLPDARTPRGYCALPQVVRCREPLLLPGTESSFPSYFRYAGYEAGAACFCFSVTSSVNLEREKPCSWFHLWNYSIGLTLTKLSHRWSWYLVFVLFCFFTLLIFCFCWGKDAKLYSCGSLLNREACPHWFVPVLNCYLRGE